MRLVLEQLRARARRDDGFTMIDMVVTMTVLSIVMVMFTAAMFQIYGAQEKTESTANAQSQVIIAFQRLDKEIRYASGISTQGLVGSDQYVEFLNSSNGAPVCWELRFRASTGQLLQRSWTQGTIPLTPTAWNQLAFGVTSTAPMTFIPADATFNFQRLQIKLGIKSGSNANATTRQTNITFTALNTSLATAGNTGVSSVCTEGRVVP